jgi:hypothetical protein
MKKLILTSTALLAFAAATYAQVINQQGQQQFAQQNQFGANQTGAINQVQSVGDPNRVNYGNYAITFQGTPNNTGANTLLINQNDGSQGNRAGIGQSGGPNNSATINQNGGINGLSGGATSTSATIGAAGEDGNFAGISQIGSANTAIINENNNARRNKAETYQNGNNNTATTNQSNNSVNNTAFVFQGFTGQNIQGTAVNNAVATIRQGKLNAGDVSVGSATPEAVNNTAVITQTASNVVASIVQGSTNILPSFTNGPGRADGADARITQSATLTTARIDQGAGGGEVIGSKASITQTATNQLAQIIQGYGAQGSDNQSTVTIVQNGASGVTGSNAYVLQGANGATDRDQAAIIQTGSVANANAQINQATQGFSAGGTYSSGDQATINQSGQGVTASITQQGISTAGAGAGESNGRDNTATITQGAGVIGNAAVTANPSFNGFTVNPGARGVAVIQQGQVFTNATLQTNRNSGIINQVTGSGLRAKVQQGGLGATFTDAAGNGFGLTALNGTPVALVGTIANDNTANITQTSGDNHNANIFQNGRFNTATVAQANGNGHQALIVQTANSQRAMASISQTSTGTGNAATILQFAGSNADGQGQYGNMASISQISGSNNVAFIQQGLQGSSTSSNDNVASVTQNGSNNFARFLQVGNNNMVNITQNGNNNQVLNLAGDPGSYGSQQGYNNRLTLVQEGGNTGVTFRYTQIGNNNTQVVNQHF